MVKVTSLLKLEHMEKAYNHSLSDETWNRGWLSKHFKECLQSVIFKSVLKLNSQLGLHTTVTLTCVLVQCQWSPLTAFTIRRPPRGGEKNPIWSARQVYCTFFCTTGLLNTALTRFHCWKIQAKLWPIHSRYGAEVGCKATVPSRSGGQGGGCDPRVFSVNGTPGLCTQDPLAFWYALFFFYFGCTGSWLQHVASLVCGMWALSCSTWYLVPWPGIKTRSLALGAQSLRDWGTRGSPLVCAFKALFFLPLFSLQPFFLHLFPLLYFEVLYCCILCVFISFLKSFVE